MFAIPRCGGCIENVFDLIIEQVLMRSVKTHGSLTRGKGMTENQHLLWVLSMPTCANINEDVKKYTSISYKTSDQLMTSYQMIKTLSSTVDLISYLIAPEPFSNNT